MSEIDLDISSEKNEIFKILKGPATFIGQWPDINVVILKCRESVFELLTNRNVLPHPFTDETVTGPVLLVRMNGDADPEDFTLAEYTEFARAHMPRRSARLLRT